MRVSLRRRILDWWDSKQRQRCLDFGVVEIRIICDLESVGVTFYLFDYTEL